MGVLTKTLLSEIFTRNGGPVKCYVETGLGCGDNLDRALQSEYFDYIAGVELSPELFRRNTERFRDSSALIIEGDSAKVIPKLAESINEPCLWYLDAHYCLGFDGHAAKNSFPLWTELQALRKRKHKDIIIVDDVHAFGRKTSDLKEGYTDDPIAWERVTPSGILKYLGAESWEHYVVNDQLVIHMQQPRGDKVRITIGVPVTEFIHVYTARYIFWDAQQNQDKFQITVDTFSPQPIDNARNWLCRRFLDRGDDFLLFIDADNPPSVGNNPLDNVEKDLDVVVYPTPMWKGDERKFLSGECPTQWNVRNFDESVNEFVEAPIGKGLQLVDVGGSGCMLIARRVIEDVQPPFTRICEPDGVVRIGADYNFCIRAIEAGYKIWADWDRVCQHIRPIDISYVDHMIRSIER